MCVYAPINPWPLPDPPHNSPHAYASSLVCMLLWIPATSVRQNWIFVTLDDGTLKNDIPKHEIENWSLQNLGLRIFISLRHFCPPSSLLPPGRPSPPLLRRAPAAPLPPHREPRCGIYPILPLGTLFGSRLWRNKLLLLGSGCYHFTVCNLQAMQCSSWPSIGQRVCICI